MGWGITRLDADIFFMTDNRKEYLNAEENADFIGRSPGAVRNLVMRRAIPYRKVGGRLVFLRSEIEA